MSCTVSCNTFGSRTDKTGRGDYTDHEQTASTNAEMGVVPPTEAALASYSCDFLKCLWTNEF